MEKGDSQSVQANKNKSSNTQNIIKINLTDSKEENNDESNEIINSDIIEPVQNTQGGNENLIPVDENENQVEPAFIDIMENELQKFNDEKENKFKLKLQELKDNYKVEKISLKNKLKIKYKEKKDRLIKDYQEELKKSNNQLNNFLMKGKERLISMNHLNNLIQLQKMIEENKFEDAKIVIKKIINGFLDANYNVSETQKDEKDEN